MKQQTRFWQFDYLINHMLSKLYAQRISDFLSHRPDAHVLDIGCGNGRWRHLFPAPARYAGLDRVAGPEVAVVASAEKIPLPDESFDLIFCNAVLEHVQDVSAAVSEMRRVLKKGGVVLLGTHGIWPIHGEPHDYRRWTNFGLAWEFKDFTTCEVPQVGGPFFNFLCVLNCYLRRWQEKTFILRILLAPWVVVNNALFFVLPDRPYRRATFAIFYLVHATK